MERIWGAGLMWEGDVHWGGVLVLGGGFGEYVVVLSYFHGA